MVYLLYLLCPRDILFCLKHADNLTNITQDIVHTVSRLATTNLADGQRMF
jgi:hypothetical protein